MHPQVEMYLPRSVLEGGAPYRGLPGAERAWADAFDLWERFESEERGVDVFGDVFIAHLRVRCFPHREGPPVEYDGHYVMEPRDGKIVYSRPYLDREEARRDAESRSARKSGEK
jgi:ketosteroid isomerase-like protein